MANPTDDEIRAWWEAVQRGEDVPPLEWNGGVPGYEGEARIVVRIPLEYVSICEACAAGDPVEHIFVECLCDCHTEGET